MDEKIVSKSSFPSLDIYSSDGKRLNLCQKDFVFSGDDKTRNALSYFESYILLAPSSTFKKINDNKDFLSHYSKPEFVKYKIKYMLKKFSEEEKKIY